MQLQAVIDFLFPPQCAVCDTPGSGLCERCFTYDARPLHFRVRTLDVMALGTYDGNLRRAILRLKDGRRDVARAFAERLEPHVRTAPYIVGVPTTTIRRLERGFDGCKLMAQLVAPDGRALGDLVQVAGDAQRGRTRLQRLAATGRFRWRGETLRGREVVLVDDVVTTGSTLEDCAATLRGAGAIVRRAVVIAHAVVAERTATELARPPLSRAYL